MLSVGRGQPAIVLHDVHHKIGPMLFAITTKRERLPPLMKQSMMYEMPECVPDWDRIQVGVGGLGCGGEGGEGRGESLCSDLATNG